MFSFFLLLQCIGSLVLSKASKNIPWRNFGEGGRASPLDLPLIVMIYKCYVVNCSSNYSGEVPVAVHFQKMRIL